MRCIVYINGRIVKWHDGNRKQCVLYRAGIVDGLEATGARMGFDNDIWSGYTGFGKSILILVQPVTS